MAEHSLNVPPPLAPHPDSIADPSLTAESEDHRALVHFCPRHSCGAIFDKENGSWMMYCPITFLEFCEALAELEIEIPPGAGVSNWFGAIKATLDSLYTAANDPA